MVVIAIVAFTIGAVISFSGEPNTAQNVIFGWAALYSVPALVIVARCVPLF
jgi:hypothetical protein